MSDPSQKIARPLLARRRENLPGGTFFEDGAAVQEDHAIRDFPGKSHLVGDDQHRHPLVGESSNHGENLTDERDPVSESELGEAQYYLLPARRYRFTLVWRL